MELECVFLPISLQFSKDQGEDAFFQVACEFSSATCGSIPSPEPFFKYLPRRHSLGAVSGVGFVCGGCAAAALAPAAWRQSAPRLAGEQKRPARDSRCAQAARPGCLEAGLTLLCRYLLAEPLPLETSLPAPHLPSTYTFPSSLSVPACSLATPLGSTSPLGFPWRGWGVGGGGGGVSAGGSVTAESGHGESGGGSPPDQGQGHQTTPAAARTRSRRQPPPGP